MPPNIPARLILEPPELEEDISELSPYSTIPLTTGTSSATIASAIPRFSTGFGVDDDQDSDIPQSAHGTYGAVVRTLKKSAINIQLYSPSSPSTAMSPQLREISRSHTLPRLPSAEKKPRKIQAELSSLHADPAEVEKMRRWILGIAVGMYFHLVMSGALYHCFSRIRYRHWTNS